MEINYDREADAMYIYLRKGKSAKTRKIDDFTLVDVDSEGNIVGFELLDVSRRVPKSSLARIHVKNIEVSEEI
jgi:uncharacterized protein YuzE